MALRGGTHRSLAAADNLTKFLTVAATLHGLLVRESAVMARPFRREGKWEGQTERGYFLKCIQRTGEGAFTNGDLVFWESTAMPSAAT